MLHSVKYLQLYSFQTANCVTFSQRRTDRLKSYLPIRYSKFLHRIVQNAYKMFIHKNLGKRRKVEHRCFCLSLHSIFPENCPLIPDQMVAALTCNPQVRWSGNRSFLGPNVVTKTVDGLCVCLSSCPYQSSVSDIVMRLESSATGDGGLIERVAIWLTIVIVHGEILHVHRPLRLERLQDMHKTGILTHSINTYIYSLCVKFGFLKIWMNKIQDNLSQYRFDKSSTCNMTWC